MMLREMQQLTLLQALALPSGKQEMLWKETPIGACIQVFAASLLLCEMQLIPALPPCLWKQGCWRWGFARGIELGTGFLLPQLRALGPRR